MQYLNNLSLEKISNRIGEINIKISNTEINGNYNIIDETYNNKKIIGKIFSNFKEKHGPEIISIICDLFNNPPLCINNIDSFLYDFNPKIPNAKIEKIGNIYFNGGELNTHYLVFNNNEIIDNLTNKEITATFQYIEDKISNNYKNIFINLIKYR